jgi:1-acyl-sn-glycerol-3-phosphate acyltransferase
LGAIGLSIFGIDLFLASPTSSVESISSISQFISTPGSIRVMVDILLIGVFGGFYIIPLNAFIQVRTKKEFRARIIAANNILNALLTVTAALSGVFFIGILNFTIPEFFLVIAIINTVVSLYIISVIPNFVMRFLVWIIGHTLYRVNHVNVENIPDEGPAVLVANHVSYIDGVIIGGACRRPIRFVVHEPIYRLPLLNYIFKTGRAIPIEGKKHNPSAYKDAFEKIKKALDAGELVCIFPEGHLTPDGEIHTFKRGIEKILKDSPVPVIPTALRGLWGSWLSRKDNKAMRRLPRGFRSNIEFVVGEPMAPEAGTAGTLEEAVKLLRGNKP